MMTKVPSCPRSQKKKLNSSNRQTQLTEVRKQGYAQLADSNQTRWSAQSSDSQEMGT